MEPIMKWPINKVLLFERILTTQIEPTVARKLIVPMTADAYLAFIFLEMF
jgi:hypothetical protein